MRKLRQGAPRHFSWSTPSWMAALVFASFLAGNSASAQTSSALTPIPADESGQVVPGPTEGARVSRQGAAAPTPAALEGPIDPATYVLGPGDGLVLSVLGRVSLDTALEVDPEGFVWLPDLGRLEVGGLTLADARRRVERMFSGGTRGLSPKLRLVRLRRFKVFVSGEVGHPGSVDVTATTRVSEALRMAGGLLADGSQRNIALERRDGSTLPVDLLTFERAGDLAWNPSLLDGDRILVPPRKRPFFLYVPAPYPGAVEHRAGDTMASAIRILGGFNPEADLERARLLRFRDDTHIDTIQVKLADVLAGRSNLPIEEGDRLYVPERADYHRDRSVSVGGEVERPGTYPLVAGADRVSQVVASAGGVTPLGNRAAVLVIRRAQDSQERDPEFERLSRLSRHDMTENEYQNFRTKLAAARAVHIVNLDQLDSGDAAGRAIAAGRDIRLEAGDAVFVDRISHSVQVGGEVRWPGLLSYTAGRSGEDYVREAGGYSGRANVSGTRLTRAATGQTILLHDAGSVEPGDLIFVPEKNDVNVWGVVRDVIVAAGAVATTVIAFRR